mmetsp:Transcript_9675/g.21463  ORF Transcript_9675/g.21463 Transcript_9675/m.21463 type:complete len:130 (+) Transcript_9675:676-1065(+)
MMDITEVMYKRAFNVHEEQSDFSKKKGGHTIKTLSVIDARGFFRWVETDMGGVAFVFAGGQVLLYGREARQRWRLSWRWTRSLFLRFSGQLSRPAPLQCRLQRVQEIQREQLRSREGLVPHPRMQKKML